MKPTLPLLPLLALGALVAALLIWSARPERESALAAAPAEPAVLAIDRAPPSEPAGALRQVAPNSAPTQAAPEQLELSADELTALQTDTAFGTLEVLVLDGRQPLGNARVLVHGELGGGAPEALAELAPHGREDFTDGRGLVRFDGVDPNQYSIRVFAPDGAMLELSTLHAKGRTRRAIAAFGSATIHGGVFDAAGLGVADCPVAVRFQHAGVQSQTTVVATRTDARGAYRLERLPAQPAIYVVRGCSGPGNGTVVTPLESGEQRRVDFGSTDRSVRWTGRAVGDDGEWIQFPLQFTTVRQGTGELGSLRCGADGTFDALLMPGSYSISATCFGNSLTLAEVHLRNADVHGDLTLPGARLLVRVQRMNSAARSSIAPGSVGVFLSSSPAVPGDSQALSGRGADAQWSDQYLFLDVPPGDYFVQTRPEALQASGGVPLTVGTEPVLHELSVTVTAP